MAGLVFGGLLFAVCSVRPFLVFGAHYYLI